MNIRLGPDAMGLLDRDYKVIAKMVGNDDIKQISICKTRCL